MAHPFGTKVKYAVGAGHGGYGVTPGKRTPDGEYEWNFNNKILLSFVDEIRKYDNVEILRLDDPTGRTDVPLSTRVSKANSWGADAYISFHNNANTGRWGDWGGTETYYYEGSGIGKELAKVVQKTQVDTLGLRDRGIKKGNHLYEIRKPVAPSILLETAFMDSTTDIKKLRDSKLLDKVGRNVAIAVANYSGLKRKKTIEAASVDSNIGKSDTPAIGKVTIMHDVLNIRTGTTLDYPKVGTAKKGETYKVFGFLNGWANIGEYRWVSNVNGDKWSKYEPYAVEDITSPKHTVDNRNGKGIGYAVVNADVLNIRTGTTLEYDIKGQAYKGDRFEVYDTLNEWLNIGKYRWISSVDGTKWSAFVKYENDSEDMKVQAKSSDEKMYRIIVDGDQIGAYSESANVLSQVRQAMPELKDSIIIEEI